MKDAIGGYLQLDLWKNGFYHENAIRLNTGRNALEYILRGSNYDKVLVPYYTCEVLLEPLQKLGVSYDFYALDKQLRPIIEEPIDSTTALLYVNYFGVCGKLIHSLSSCYNTLIIDNSQAFYDQALEGIPTLYSPRKFFGLPDGGLAINAKKLDQKLEQDISHERMSHLLKRIDLNAESGYSDFSQNDGALVDQPMKSMSKLTSALLGNIDFELIKNQRKNNFDRLHKALLSSNEFPFGNLDETVPLVYPYLIADGSKLKKKLIDNRIYVATYWENMRTYIPDHSFEEHLLDNLVPIPIDQRLSKSDMERIIQIILD